MRSPYRSILLLSFVLFTVAGLEQALCAAEFRAKLSPGEIKAIWLKECRISLWVAMDSHGSKVSFPSVRDRKAFGQEICEKAVSGQLSKLVKLTSLSPEKHACLYIADRGDLIPGFGRDGTEGVMFMAGYCSRR